MDELPVTSGDCLPLEEGTGLNKSGTLIPHDTPTTILTERGGGEGQLDLSSDTRDVIDQEVYSWVMTQINKNKVITSNHIRQKAYEIGQQYDQYFKASLNWYNKWKKKVNYEEQPEIDALRNRKRSYTAAFKLHAVQRSTELVSVSQASLELNVSRRCLQRWKEEVDVISSVAEKASNAIYRRPGQGRKVGDRTLDLKLVEWIQEAWKEGQQVSSSTVRQKARDLSTNPDFKASLGWYMKWQKRHNVNLKEKIIDSPAVKSLNSTPLKLRLLPEGQQCAYSDRMVQTHKRRRTLGDQPIGVIEGGGGDTEAEFDRILLTWLVERWDSSDNVTERMLREKANEILSSPSSFRPTKSWLLDWMKKYNVSLENQTFGMGGETEGEIVEESQVYDDITVQQESSPLTPTKEEAATALASLASEDPGGLEIAEALQKLASAFGLNQENGKEAVVQQLAALSEQMTSQPSLISPSPVLPPDNIITSTPPLPPATDPSYLLEEGVVQLGTEDVISEEIVTDDNVVVYDDTTGLTGGTMVTGHSDNIILEGGGGEMGVARSDVLTSTGSNIQYEIVGGANGSQLLSYTTTSGPLSRKEEEGGDMLTTPTQEVFVTRLEEDVPGDLLATPTQQVIVTTRGEEEVTTDNVIIDNSDNIINDLITGPALDDVMILKSGDSHVTSSDVMETFEQEN